jgi:hypothetical protein
VNIENTSHAQVLSATAVPLAGLLAPDDFAVVISGGDPRDEGATGSP